MGAGCLTTISRPWTELARRLCAQEGRTAVRRCGIQSMCAFADGAVSIHSTCAFADRAVSIHGALMSDEADQARRRPRPVPTITEAHDAVPHSHTDTPQSDESLKCSLQRANKNTVQVGGGITAFRSAS